MANDQGSVDASSTGRGIIEAQNVVFAYGNTPVVSDVSVTVPRGAVAALIGANGSGKSTLIRLLAGLLTPASGQVLIDGLPLTNLTPRDRAKRIAYVPQSIPTIFPFTAMEVVLTGRSPYSARFKFESEADESIALQTLELLDAAHLANRPITELSGGERQLVTVARALAQEPDVMLLDEPASSLDLKHRTELTRALRRLSDERGIGVLMVTHDLMLLDTVADLILALKCGRMLASGAPRSVFVEETLSDVFDARVRTERLGDRTFIWPEL